LNLARPGAFYGRSAIDQSCEFLWPEIRQIFISGAIFSLWASMLSSDFICVLPTRRPRRNRLLFGPQTIGDRDFACTRTAIPDAPPENIRRERFRTRLPDLNQLRHQMIDQVIGVNAGCLLPLRILTKCHKPDR